MLQAVQLYYKKGLTRQVIARQMHIESKRVSTLLDEAKRTGIVKIVIDETVESDLEPQIMGMFTHLKKLIIVKAAPYAELPKSLGIAAAKYFDDEIVKDSARKGKPLHVAVTGNETLLEFVNALPDAPRNLFIHVSALVGQGRLPKYATSHFHPQAVASMLWSKSGRIPGHVEFATVSPYIPATPGEEGMNNVRTELAKVETNKTVRQVIEAMDRIDVVFGGIGVVNPKRVSSAIRNRVTMEAHLQYVITPQQLAAKGAVGDYSYAPFTSTGEPVPDCRFFLTAGHYSRYKDINFFRHMSATRGKRVIGFGGMLQLPAIRAALTGKIINVLITDETTAREIAKGS